MKFKCVFKEKKKFGVQAVKQGGVIRICGYVNMWTKGGERE